MRRVVITVEDTLPNGKYVAASDTFDLLANDGDYLPVACALSISQRSDEIDNRLWIEGSREVATTRPWIEGDSK